MENTLKTIYLATVIISVLIAILIIAKEKEITVLDVLVMIIAAVIPAVNIGFFGYAYFRMDDQNDGPISRFLVKIGKVLNTKLKK